MPKLPPFLQCLFYLFEYTARHMKTTLKIVFPINAIVVKVKMIELSR